MDEMIAKMAFRFQDPWAARFVQEALPKIKAALDPQMVLLFGSRIKGKGTEDSDLDVIVVSDYFKGKRVLGRMPFMLRMIRFPRPVDFLCYSSEEFERIKDASIIVREAVKEGVAVTP